jgi:hypothetical protein
MGKYNEVVGDLFDYANDGCTILHIVNCQNKFGAGFAKVLAKKYPIVKGYYHMFFDANSDVDIDQMLGYVQVCVADQEKQVLVGNMFCQEFYGRDKNIVYVDYDAVRVACEFYGATNAKIKIEHGDTNVLNKIMMPMIGTGLANGDWDIISNIIKEILVEKYDLDVTVYTKE